MYTVQVVKGSKDELATHLIKKDDLIFVVLRIIVRIEI